MQMQKTDDSSPSYFGWRYSDGTIRITVEGLGEHVDGDTLFTFSLLAGVEVGSSKVISLAGRPDIIVFEGTYEEQRKCFDAWAQLAEANTRAATFHTTALAKLIDRHP